MAYLLDTDVVIDRLARNPATIQLLGRLAPAGFSMSIISYIEVLQGVLLSPDPPAERANRSPSVALPSGPIWRDASGESGLVPSTLS